MHSFSLNFRAKAQLVWERVTFSRITVAYLVLAVLHCIIQVVFQSQAFAINQAAAHRLWAIVVAGGFENEARGFAVLGDDLRICYNLPDKVSTETCQVIWGGDLLNKTSANAANIDGDSYAMASSSSPTSTVAPSSSSSSSTSHSASSTVTSTITVLVAPSSKSSPTTISSPTNHNSVRKRLTSGKRMVEVTPLVVNGSQIGVNLLGLHMDTSATGAAHMLADEQDVTQITDTCIKSLIWPVQQLENTEREDITLIAFQVWVLGMSIVSLLNESIPHIIAALLTHLLATTWTVFQLSATDQFRKEFGRLTTQGACKPVNLLGSYWIQRRNAEIPSAALNAAALVASAFLTYKLVKLYGWQTFKRVGASLTINRIYKLVLSLSIVIQLALFFIVASMAIWIDQLYNGSVARLSILKPVYRAVTIVLFVGLVPWLAMGWFSMRREKRIPAVLFLLFSLLFIALWGAMFKSPTFRWTFTIWTFFSVMAVAALVLTTLTFVLGVLCLLNFGKGLPRYLSAQEPLDDNDDGIPPSYEQDYKVADPEKIDFPATHAVPTFSAAFGLAGSDSVASSQDQPQSQNRDSVSSFGSETRGVRAQRSDLVRIDTRSSDRSYRSASSQGSSHSGRSARRWVIE